MTRRNLPLLLATLALGISIGVALDRGGRPLSADPQQAAANVHRAADVPGASPSRPRGEEAIYDQLGRQYEQFAHVNRTFELVARAVSPSVVHLVSRKVTRNREEGRVQEFEETGSGVIVRSDRLGGLYVLTNNHVVAGADTSDVSIALSDGRTLHPEKIWFDSKADVAVLKLTRQDLPAARLGNSDDLPVGTWVMAIGSPFGLTHSVSQGIVSGRGRHEADLEKAGVENQDFLQTDAAINPGNSGGPLVNMKGEVVGLNIAILSNGGGNEGVGFSIPINLARWIMNQLVENGRVNRGALGVKLQPDFTHENAVELGLDRPKGAWVESVDRTSPAAQAGLKTGDVILKFNGQEVVDLNHLINLVSMAPIGRPADLVLWRDKSEVAIRVTVADKERAVASNPTRTRRPAPENSRGLLRRPERPEADAPAPVRNEERESNTASVIGLEMVTLNGPMAEKLGLPGTMRGAAITKVEPDSPLAAYLKPLDVIQSVGGQAVNSAPGVVQTLGNNAAQDHLEIIFERVLDGQVKRFSVRMP